MTWKSDDELTREDIAELVRKGTPVTVRNAESRALGIQVWALTTQPSANVNVVRERPSFESADLDGDAHADLVTAEDELLASA